MTYCTLPLEHRPQLREFLAELGTTDTIIENVLTIGDQTHSFDLVRHVGPWIDRVRAHYGVEEPIYYAVLTSSDIQAYAIKVEGVYCIVIFLGALLKPGNVATSASFAPNMAPLLNLNSAEPINSDLVNGGTQFDLRPYSPPA